VSVGESYDGAPEGWCTPRPLLGTVVTVVTLLGVIVGKFWRGPSPRGRFGSYRVVLASTERRTRYEAEDSNKGTD